MDTLEIIRRHETLTDGKSFSVWTLVCSGKVIARSAPAFSADEGNIWTRCLDDGSSVLPVILARRWMDVVIWIAPEDVDFASKEIVQSESPRALAPREMYVFASADYQEAVNDGDVFNLEPIRAAELSGMIRCLKIPDPDKAIYAVGPNTDDTVPSSIANFVKSWLEDRRHEFDRVTDVDNYSELTLGFDNDTLKESIWHVGHVGPRPAIRFEENPCFPIWIVSPPPLNNAVPPCFGIEVPPT
jgi:hypothetical protein